ncbi:MAG: YfcC family protein [Vicinamibacterales bacterium]
MRFPHPLTLLVGCVILAAVLTHIIPAGEYDRREDPATGRMVVVPGSYHAVESNPLGVLETGLAFPKGLIEAASVLAVILIGGGAFVVVDRTGAFRVALAGLVRRLGTRRSLALPITAFVFATGGALENMQEEIIALVPLLLVFMGRLGYNNVTAVAVSVGAAAVGSAFSPMNPFQVGIAQQLAQVPLFSGGLFRSIVLAIAFAIWVAYTMRYAARSAVPVREDSTVTVQADELSSGCTALILAVVLIAFAIFVAGLIQWGWGFDHLTAVLFIAGVLAGLIGRLGMNGTAEAYVQGFRDMAFAAVLVGFARAISVVLTEGRIIDSVVHGLFTPLDGLPAAGAAIAMMLAHNVIHVPVPSVSGQAALTMPILVPLSDLLMVSRQVTILAYQYGAGLCEILTPTNGALMAVIAAANVRYDEWIRFAWPAWLMLTALGAAAILTGLAIGLS